MLHEFVVTRIAYGVQDSIKGMLHLLNCRNLILIVEHEAYVRLVEIVIIKEEVEHLIYAGHEPLLTLILPDRPRITFLQLLKIEHQFTPNLGKRKARLGRLNS